MLLPAFKVPPQLQTITVMLKLGYIANGVIPTMQKLLKTLSNKKEKVHETDPEKLTQFLERKISQLVQNKVNKAIPTGNQEYQSLDITQGHRYTSQGWQYVVKIESGCYYPLYVKPLAEIKKKNVLLYTVVRDLLRVIMSSGKVPGMQYPEIIEWAGLDEQYDDPGNFDDLAAMKDYQKNLRRSLQNYKSYMAYGKTIKENRRVIKLAQKRIKRIAPRLAPETVSLLRDLLKAACLCCVEYEINSLDTSYDEVNPIYSTFALLWDENDYESEYFLEMMNEQWGNTGAATLFYQISGSDNVRSACLTIRTIAILQKIFFHIWDL